MISRLKRIGISTLDFLLYSNIFISLCALAQGLVTYHLLKVQPNITVLALLFLSTLPLYNFGYLISKPKHPENSKHQRVRWFFSHYRLNASITIIAALMLVPLFLLFIHIQAQICLVFLGIVAIGYNLPFLTLNGRHIGLRNIPGIKLFMIAFVWAVSSVLLPILELESTHHITISTTEMALLIGKRFLFVAAITVPFDIRDLFEDSVSELKTIPVMLGERKAYIFCSILLVGYLALLFIFNNGPSLDFYGLTLTILLTAWLIFKSNIKKNEYYYFLFLDGTMILQYLILLLTSSLNHLV